MKNRVKESGGNPYISGRSSIIELVAIQAARERRNQYFRGTSSVLATYKGRVDNIYINFFDSVTRPRPLILDAVIPFNNYAKPIKPIHKVYFHLRAEKTLITLGQAEDGRDYEVKFSELLNLFV
ncbi:unnamed protein product [Allacma fusca]|uniref:Uncharacterized protein n=1 Tax=Allacma fusca TaxID=39272 RepID=A0A8J2NQU8_9HEXA|nr:unnamed protein product [Allacma fusca]